MNAAVDNTAELSTREARRHFLGGSDIAAMLGIAPGTPRCLRINRDYKRSIRPHHSAQRNRTAAPGAYR